MSPGHYLVGFVPCWNTNFYVSHIVRVDQEGAHQVWSPIRREWLSTRPYAPDGGYDWSPIRFTEEHGIESLTAARRGDFYEWEGQQAEVVVEALNITITSRGDEPMCGAPAHSIGKYIARLEELGFHVALVPPLTSEES